MAHPPALLGADQVMVVVRQPRRRPYAHLEIRTKNL